MPRPVENSPARRPRVLALVLNWNRIDFTAPCVASLAKQEFAGVLDILLIDNGSTEHTPEELHRACPGATLLAIPQNRGFAGAMNMGMRHPLAKKADFLWLLNNDTVCAPTALADLVKKMADARVGACASRLVQAGTNPPKLIRGAQALRPPLYIPFPLREGAPIGYLCGASLLLRKAAVEAVGMLDEAFPFFFEDADWSFRARDAGWLLAETDRASVTHVGSATISSYSRDRSRGYRAGHVRFLRRHARHPFPAAAVAMAWRCAVDLCLLRLSSLRGSIEGWKAGWRD